MPCGGAGAGWGKAPSPNWPVIQSEPLPASSWWQQRRGLILPVGNKHFKHAHLYHHHLEIWEEGATAPGSRSVQEAPLRTLQALVAPVGNRRLLPHDSSCPHSSVLVVRTDPSSSFHLWWSPVSPPVLEACPLELRSPKCSLRATCITSSLPGDTLWHAS